METRTFLDKLPSAAMSKPVVAKVKILSSKTEKRSLTIDSKIIAEAKVIESLKGVGKGTTIQVVVELHSCSNEPRISAGQTFYLAGSLAADGSFRGEWKYSELETN